MNTAKLENLEAIALIVLVMTSKIILNLPKTILTNIGTSSWINAIYISFLALLAVLLIVHLFKNFPGYDILDISKYLGGETLKKLMAIFYIVFFIVNATLIVRSFSESIKIIYFNNLPLIIIIAFFVISSCIANIFGLKALAKTNLIVAPLALLSIIITIISSIQNFVPQRLFPILGHGLSQTFISGSNNIFLFSILAYLFFLVPILQNQKDYKKVSIISVLVSAFYLIASIICLQLVFPFIYQAKEHLSIYLLIRMAHSGDIIQRFISFFFFVWILSVLCYISISIYFSVHVTTKITNISNTKCITYLSGLLVFGCTLLFNNYSQYTIIIEKIFKPSTTIFLFIINIIVLLLANIKLKIKKGLNLNEKNL